MPTTRTLGTGSLFRRVSRLTKKQLPVWHLSYSVRLSDGRTKQVRESSKTTDRTAALELLHQRVGASTKGVVQADDRRAATVKKLLADLSASYREEKRGSRANVESAARILNEAIGDMRPVEVTTKTLRTLVREWRRDGASPATCNRRVQILRTAFNFGDVLVDPARLKFKAAMLPEKSPRAKFIDRAAFGQIHGQLPDDLKDAFELSYLLGKRRAQLLSTCWTHVDVTSWTVTWPADTTKTGEVETLKLAGRPLAIMKARWKARQPEVDLVFHRHGHRIVDARKAWAKACKAAGFPIGRKNGGFEWRATRHSAMTNLLNAGVPIHEAMLITGHKTLSVVKRYSLGIEAQQAKALEAVSAAHPTQRPRRPSA